MSAPGKSTDSPVLVTGATGSFGAALVRYLLDNTAHRVRCYSRGEHRQNELAAALGADARLTFIIGDVRDRARLSQAAEGCSAIVHSAALKSVGNGETNPAEFILTNTIGTDNAIAAALSAGVPRTLLISSDKAVQAINLYGSTKACAESLICQANRLGAPRGLRFASVRGGNVWASQGSVAVVWRAQLGRGETIRATGADSTRFHLQMPDWIRFAWQAVGAMRGGEVFVPKAPAWELADLAEVFAPGAWEAAPRRPGDKQHETLVSGYEAPRTVDIGWAYAIEPHPALSAVWAYDAWAGPALSGEYSSDRARRMTADELRQLVREL